MDRIDVVVPTWNAWPLLQRCLATLDRQTVPKRIVVVDNASTDGTAELLAERHPDVALVRMTANRGFAVAVNAGIAAGSAPVVVLVNNDVECDPDFLERLVAPLETDSSIGAVAGLLLTPGRTTVDSFGLELDRTLAAYARYYRAPFPAARLDSRHLAGPSGAAAAYRRSALADVGGFDEALFAYLEDADLALRLRDMGWRCAGAPDAIGVHLGSASFGRRSDWQVETAAASRAYLLRKYGVLRFGVAVAAWTLAAELAVVAADLVLARRLAATRGRVRGWRRGRGASATVPVAAVNPELGFRASLDRRRAAITA